MNEFDELLMLDELYVGETPFISKLINAVSKAREPYVGKLKKPIKGNKDFIKIGDMIAEEFGFHAVTFMVPYDVSMNAFTYPITMAIDKSVSDIKPKFFADHGLKYDKSTSQLCIIVAVTAGVWFNEDFSDREVVAAMLHEIGHSFVLQSERMISIIESNRICILVNLLYSIILTLIGALKNPNPFNLAVIPVYVKKIMYSTNKGKEIINQTSKILAENKYFKVFNGASTISEWIAKVIFNIFKDIFSIISDVGKIIAIPIAMINKLFPVSNSTAAARSQEYLSDSFATMYGLGPETATFLTKIETSANSSGYVLNTTLNKIPIIGALRNTLDIPILYFTNSFTTHPSTPARINKILQELNTELKDSDLDPKTKKAVQSNIKELEKIKDEIAKPADKKLLANGEDVKRMWLSFLMNKDYDDNYMEKYYTDLKERDKYVKQLREQYEDIVSEFGLI